jgi:HEPN domain-containing protein
VVEKSIKAVLAANGVDFPFSHDIGRLGALASKAGRPLPNALRNADELSAYAGALRYEPDDPESVDRETGLRWATTAVTWAQAQIEDAEERAAANDLAPLRRAGDSTSRRSQVLCDRLSDLLGG